jgi:anti-sigma factor RsiW
MDEAASQLSEREMAELCALADGSLPPDRRAAVEAWVAGSPELQFLLERQRRSLEASRVAASEPMPPSLPTPVEAQLHRTRRRGARRLVPRLAFGGVAAGAVAVALIIAFGGRDERADRRRCSGACGAAAQRPGTGSCGRQSS